MLLKLTTTIRMETMSKDTLVKVSADVTKECRKYLKIMALEKDTTLALLVTDILERTVGKSGKKSSVIQLENSA